MFSIDGSPWKKSEQSSFVRVAVAGPASAGSSATRRAAGRRSSRCASWSNGSRMAAGAAGRTGGRGWGGAVYALSSFRRSSSGSFAMLAAMRRASSRARRCAAARLPGSSSKWT